MDLKKTLRLAFLVCAIPAVASAQEGIKFPVGASSKVLGYAPLWAADKIGFFRRAGLDAEVTVTRGTSPSMQALVSDSIHVALAASALSAGNIAAAILAVPVNFRAQEMGFNLIGKVTDVFPNYLLSSFSVRRSWAEAHRQEVVRFLKAVLQARKWLETNQSDAAEFLARELDLKPRLAKAGLEYYLSHGAWEPDLSIDLDGLKPVIEIYAEQAGMKGAVPNPQNYVDLSYLKQAWQESGSK